MSITVELFAAVSGEARSEVEAEAATLAPYKDCTRASVEYTEVR